MFDPPLFSHLLVLIISHQTRFVALVLTFSNFCYTGETNCVLCKFWCRKKSLHTHWTKYKTLNKQFSNLKDTRITNRANEAQLPFKWWIIPLHIFHLNFSKNENNKKLSLRILSEWNIWTYLLSTLNLSWIFNF